MSKSNDKINICHVISGDLWAGAETQAYSLAEELAETPWINLSVVTFNSGLLASKLSKIGIQVTVIEEKNRNIFTMIWRLHNFLKKNEIDILHVHGFKENFVGGISAKLSNAKVIRTHHGKGMLEGCLRHKIIEKLNARHLTNRMIAVSQDLKNYLAAKKFDESKITVILNGIKPERKEPLHAESEIRTRLDINAGRTIIGTIGRIVSVKGYDYLLKGAGKVIEKKDKVIFLIVGDGPLLEKMKKLSNELGIEEYVRFAGFSDHPRDMLRLFDIFIMTSFHEGIPMVLLEAMSMSKPIIATNVGGIPEIIKNGRNGVLIPARDSEAISAACLYLLNDDVYRGQLAHNAYDDVQKKHSLSIMKTETAKLYRELLL
jgi:glycosyltransferase involved in cell wall biosynthesis